VTGFKTDTQGDLIEKSPGDALDYELNWDVSGDSWLGTDKIVTATWNVDSGLTVITQAKTNTTATIWLSGGTLGVTYWVKCTIVTAAGRTKSRSFRVVIAQQ
jgi:hypothetical protein